MEAVDWMLQRFMMKYDIDSATYSFSVSLKEKDSKLRNWKGKDRKAVACMYQIFFLDILAIVRISCDSSQLHYGIRQSICSTKGSSDW